MYDLDVEEILSARRVDTWDPYLVRFDKIGSLLANKFNGVSGSDAA